MFSIGDIVLIKSDDEWVESNLDVMAYDLRSVKAEIVYMDFDYYTLQIPNDILPHGQDSIKFRRLEIDGDKPNDHFDIISTLAARE